MIPYSLERRMLQAAIFIGGFVPILSGGSGILMGAEFLGDAGNAAMESHFRYLSALLFAIAFAFWSCIRNPETKEPRARLLTAIVFFGGLIRLNAAIFAEWPPAPMIFAIVMEIVIVPLLYLWLRRIARLSTRQA